MGKKRKRAKPQPRSRSSVITKPPRPVDLGYCGSLSHHSLIGNPPSPVDLSGEQQSPLGDQNDYNEVKSVINGVKNPCNVTDGDELQCQAGNRHPFTGVRSDTTTSLLDGSVSDIATTKEEEKVEINKQREPWIIPSSPPMSEDSEESLNGDDEVDKPTTPLSTNEENLPLGLKTDGLKGNLSHEILRTSSHVDVKGIRRFQIKEGDAPYSTRLVVGLQPGQVHSPLWTGALVIDAEKRKEKSNNDEEEGNRKGKHHPSSHKEGQRRRFAENLSHPVEQQVYSIAQALFKEGNYMVVIAFATWEELASNCLGPGPDADDLSKLMDTHFQPDDSAGETVETKNTRHVYRVCRLLRLPGFQVVMDGMDRVKQIEPLSISIDWYKAVNSIVKNQTRQPPTVIICGAKGAGKSTLCRYTINRLLMRYSSVALLDCDVGQPEIGPPGLISLHVTEAPFLSPPHLNNLQKNVPEVAYYVGSTSPKQEPGHFTACVSAATSVYRQLYQPSLSEPSQATPLIVNTPGWVKGMGEHLLGSIVDIIRPQHIFKLSGITVAKKFQLDRVPQDCCVHELAAFCWHMKASRVAAADLRTLSFVSYFLSNEDIHAAAQQPLEAAPPCTKVGRVRVVDSSDCQSSVGKRKGVNGGLEPCVRNGVLHDPTAVIARALAMQKPFRVPWHCLVLRVLGGDISHDMTLMALNGTLVGLIIEHHEKLEEPSTPFATVDVVTDKDGTNTTDCEEDGGPTRCLGLGIVRAVDADQQELFVLTPLPINDLMQCNALYRGSCLNIPIELLYDPQRDQHCRWCSSPQSQQPSKEEVHCGEQFQFLDSHNDEASSS